MARTKAAVRRSIAAKKGWETRRKRAKLLSDRAKKGWKTRKAAKEVQEIHKRRKKAPRREPAPQDYERAERRAIQFESRSAASKKGWEVRRAKRIQKESRVSALSAVTWGELPSARANHLMLGRQVCLGNASTLHGANPEDRKVLETMISAESKKWLLFKEGALKAGFSMKQIRTAWFSPKGKAWK